MFYKLDISREKVAGFSFPFSENRTITIVRRRTTRSIFRNEKLNLFLSLAGAIIILSLRVVFVSSTAAPAGLPTRLNCVVDGSKAAG